MQAIQYIKDFFDFIINYLTEQLGPLGPLYAAGVLGLFLVLVSLPFMLKKNVDPVDRLNEKKKVKETTDAGAPKLRFESKGPNLEKFANFLEPKDKNAFSAVELKLIQAGYRDKTSVRTFHFMQFALAIAFLLVGVLVGVIRMDQVEAHITLLTILLPAGVGYYLPTYWVERRKQTRQQNLTEGFPDALDLMLVCVEAGQSLDQSIQRVGSEIRPGFPDLADEFEIVANQMKAGKDRVSVLRDMSERAGAQDISAFVTVLIQSATFGTSISDALRVYAAEMRDKRVMRAEEKANTLPTKLTLGTMMFTLPPLLIILIGPSIYDIYLTLVVGQQ